METSASARGSPAVELALERRQHEPIAFAAPVVVGIMLTAAARARRRSPLCGRSRMCWSLVYECTVTIRPFMMPKLSFSTLAIGARQLVVHDAFETMRVLGRVVLRVVDAHATVTSRGSWRAR
jgi:hypothetical protein